MIWTLLAFGVTLFVLRKLAFPRIAEALDKRQQAIEESIDDGRAHARARPTSCSRSTASGCARRATQADEIVARARKAGEVARARVARGGQRAKREELLEQTRRDIEAETRRAIQEIRTRGRRPHGARHREGHAQDARRGRPAPARRGGARASSTSPRSAAERARN